MSLHYSWGNPLNCLYTIFKVVKMAQLQISVAYFCSIGLYFLV